MIKAIMLIFEPVLTWNKIVQAQKSFAFVLLVFLTPLIVLSVGGEMAGIYYFSKHVDGANAGYNQKKLEVYAAAQFLLSFVVVFVGAKLVKSLAETFHSRHTFTQGFTVVAYGLSPLFLFHLLDIYPGIYPWASFGIGMVLCLATLYYGVPRVLQPDPPNAFGIYLMTSILLSGIAGLAHYITMLILQGKIKLF